MIKCERLANCRFQNPLLFTVRIKYFVYCSNFFHQVPKQILPLYSNVSRIIENILKKKVAFHNRSEISIAILWARQRSEHTFNAVEPQCRRRQGSNPQQNNNHQVVSRTFTLMVQRTNNIILGFKNGRKKNKRELTLSDTHLQSRYKPLSLL